MIAEYLRALTFFRRASISTSRSPAFRNCGTPSLINAYVEMTPNTATESENAVGVVSISTGLVLVEYLSLFAIYLHIKIKTQP